MHNKEWTSIQSSMKRAEILNLKRKVIVLKKKKSNRGFIATTLIVVSLLLISNFFITGDSFKSMMGRVSYVYNPVNSLYNDNSSAIFTSGSLIEKEAINFIIPIKTTSYSVDEFGGLVFDVTNSIMVMACEDGVVEDIKTSLDGVKHIKIRHTLGIFSIIENVDIVGVAIGESVKKGQDIATSVIGAKVKLVVYENDQVVSNLKINQSKIVWQK